MIADTWRNVSSHIHLPVDTLLQVAPSLSRGKHQSAVLILPTRPPYLAPRATSAKSWPPALYLISHMTSDMGHIKTRLIQNGFAGIITQLWLQNPTGSSMLRVLLDPATTWLSGSAKHFARGLAKAHCWVFQSAPQDSGSHRRSPGITVMGNSAHLSNVVHGGRMR